MQATVAVDIAKNVFEVAVSLQPGRVAERHRLRRAAFLRFFAQRRPLRVLLEACGTSHHWARELDHLGHRVLLLPPHLVRPYRHAHKKTDRADAKALLEAYRNEEIRPVPVKTVSHQALTALHRLRAGWMDTRTRRINAIRGLLREFGHPIPQGARHVVPAAWALLEDAEVPLPDPFRRGLAEAILEIQELERRIGTVEAQLRALASEIPAVAHLLSVPGIGLLTATALVAFVTEIHRFPSGRRFAAYLGLTPREHSTGSTRRLGPISKRGDTYLRKLLIHSARSRLVNTKRRKTPSADPLDAWAHALEHRSGHNLATVALANRLARIAWRVWRDDRDYEQRRAA